MDRISSWNNLVVVSSITVEVFLAMRILRSLSFLLRNNMSRKSICNFTESNLWLATSGRKIISFWHVLYADYVNLLKDAWPQTHKIWFCLCKLLVVRSFLHGLCCPPSPLACYHIYCEWSKAKELLIRCLSIGATLPLCLPFTSQTLDKTVLLMALIIETNIKGR